MNEEQNEPEEQENELMSLPKEELVELVLSLGAQMLILHSQVDDLQRRLDIIVGLEES